MKPVTPNISVRPSGAVGGADGVHVMPGKTGTLPNGVAAPARPVSGITNPGDIRSNVADKPLKIPDFLQKK